MGVISDIAHIEMGQSPDGSSTNRSGIGDPLLNGPSEFGDAYPEPQQWTDHGVRFAEPGDTLFCVRGSTTGKMNVADQRFAIGRGLAAIRGKGSEADTRFTKYALKYVLPELLAGVTGSVFPNLSRSQIGSQRLLIPTEPTRKAIAEVLGSLDDKIVSNTELAAKVEEIAVVSLSGESSMVALGEVVRLHRNSVSPTSIDEPEVAHFSLPAFDVGVLPAFESPRDIKSSKFRLDRPVVLLSKLNPRFPRVWHVASIGGRPALASTEFLVLEPLNSDTAALWAALSQSAFSLALDAKVSGTSGSHQRVKPDDALNTMIVDPTSIGGDRSALVNNLLSIAGRARGENRTLAATRDALLPQLMSGKLRVRDAEKVLEGVL